MYSILDLLGMCVDLCNNMDSPTDVMYRLRISMAEINPPPPKKNKKIKKKIIFGNKRNK